MKIDAIVFKKDGKPKEARGFSIKELEKAALDFRKALKLGIPVDLRRTTFHEENVEVLKEHLKSRKTGKKTREKEAQSAE